MKSIIEEYYEEYGKLVHNYLYKMSGDYALAEELTQETFYQGMRTIGKYRGDCKPSVWLCQIARHVWYKYLDKKKKYETVSIDDVEIPDTKNCIDSFHYREDRLALYREIQELEENTREVIYLRILGDLSFQEIGIILNKSENWARVTYFKRCNTVVKILMGVAAIVSLLFLAAVGLIVFIVMNWVDKETVTDISQYEYVLGENGKYRDNFGKHNYVFPDEIPESAKIDEFEYQYYNPFDPCYLGYLVYHVNDEDPKTNTFIYVELQYCNYFTDINYEKTIDEKYLPIGFDASQGNPTEIEIRKKYY